MKIWNPAARRRLCSQNSSFPVFRAGTRDSARRDPPHPLAARPDRPARVPEWPRGAWWERMVDLTRFMDGFLPCDYAAFWVSCLLSKLIGEMRPSDE